MVPGGLKPGLGPLRGRVLKDMFGVPWGARVWQRSAEVTWQRPSNGLNELSARHLRRSPSCGPESSLVLRSS